MDRNKIQRQICVSCPSTDPDDAKTVIRLIREEIEKVDLSRFAPASTVEATRKAILSLLGGKDGS